MSQESLLLRLSLEERNKFEEMQRDLASVRAECLAVMAKSERLEREFDAFKQKIAEGNDSQKKFQYFNCPDYGITIKEEDLFIHETQPDMTMEDGNGSDHEWSQPEADLTFDLQQLSPKDASKTKRKEWKPKKNVDVKPSRMKNHATKRLRSPSIEAVVPVAGPSREDTSINSPPIVKIAKTESNNLYQCKICHRDLKNKRALKTHHLRNHGPKDLQCDKCGFETADGNSFWRHHVRKHAECFSCGQQVPKVRGISHALLAHEKECPNRKRRRKRSNL